MWRTLQILFALSVLATFISACSDSTARQRADSSLPDGSVLPDGSLPDGSQPEDAAIQVDGPGQSDAQNPSSTELVGWGVSFHPEVTQDQDYDLMAQARINVARFDLKWDRVEVQQGTYDFSFYDDVFAKLSARGIRAYAILDYNNPLYGAGAMDGITTDDQRNGFVAFAQAAANTYKNRNVIWEIWNEPNLGYIFWRPTEDAHLYTLLVKAVYPVVKQADPSSTVVGPATAYIANYASFFQDCVNEGLLDYLDAISTHPYKDQAPELGAIDQIYDDYRQIMQSAGHPDMPLIAGEVGYTANWVENDVELQGKYDLRHLLFSVHKGVNLWMKYDLVNDCHDPGGDPECNFGMLWHDRTPKPTYTAYQLMTTTLEGTAFDQSLSAGSGNFVLRWTGPGGKKVYAYWTAASNNQQAVDGQTFDLTDTVQYLTIP